MKTHFTSLVIILILLSIRLPSLAQENLVANLNIPGDDIINGINPEDIIFADGKFFVCGLGTVLVLNPANNYEIVNTLTFSERGQYVYDAFGPVCNNPPHSLMTFDVINHRLFVISPDNEIFIINTSGNGSLETTFIEKPVNVPSLIFERSMIRYDPLNERLFWVITWTLDQVSHSYLGCYSANEPYQNIWEEELIGDGIYDITINEVDSYFYLSRNNKIQVSPTDGSSFQIVKTLNTYSPNKDLLYIHTDYLHRIYCVSYSNIYWIDGDNYGTHGYFPAPENDLRCATYCPQYDEVYFSGYYSAYIFDGSNPQSYISVSLIGNYNYEEVYHLECYNNIVFACKPSELITIDALDHSTQIKITKANNYFGPAALNPATSDVVVTNMEGASLERFNSSGVYSSNILTGVSVFKSCYNSDDNKFYFFSNELHDDSRLVIVNYLNNSYNIDDIIEFEDNISACAYNANTDCKHILVSTYSNSQQISKLNGSDNQPAGSITLASGYCENVFITPEPDNKIYCATGMNSLQNASIEVFNAQDYSWETSLDNLGTGFADTDFRIQFCYDSHDNFVFFILYKRSAGTPWGYLGKIEPNNNFSYNLYSLPENPEKIIYCSKSNKIFIQYNNETYLTAYDCTNLTNPIIYEYGNTIFDIVYAEHSDYVYVLCGYDLEVSRIYVTFSSESEPVYVHWYEVPPFVYSLSLNSLNKKIYAYSPFGYGTLNFENHLYAVDPIMGSIADIYLENSQSVRYANPVVKNEPIVDPGTGYMLVPNGSHSNISVIECPERIPITNKYNWISFPRLYRDENGVYPAVDALTGRIHPPMPYEIEGKMEIEEVQGEPYPQEVKKYIIKLQNSNVWNPIPGDLNYVASHKGYVLTTNEYAYSRKLDIYGTMLDPDFIFDEPLYQYFDNWVGYFLPVTQSPFDAIATEFLDNIGWMAGQYWYCHKEIIHTKNSGYSWVCACAQGRIEIKYGDMIKVFPWPEDINDFHWQMPGQPPQIAPKLAVEYFQYQEQAAYDPYMIELDTSDLPLEIGAFAGDSCIGASKVYSNDTVVLVRGFTEGFEGEPITFEMYYGPEKSTSGRIRDYMVSTPGQAHWQKRTIVAGEKQYWFDISFKEETNSSVEKPVSWMNCRPNPFNHTCTIDYSIPENSIVQLEVMDVFGKCAQSLEEGNKGRGEYTAIFNTEVSGLGKGVYFIRMITDREILTKKVVYVY